MEARQVVESEAREKEDRQKEQCSLLVQYLRVLFPMDFTIHSKYYDLATVLQL